MESPCHFQILSDVFFINASLFKDGVQCSDWKIFFVKWHDRDLSKGRMIEYVMASIYSFQKKTTSFKYFNNFFGSHSTSGRDGDGVFKG